MNITENTNSKIAYFMLPGFCEHYKTYQRINNFLKKYPEAQRENAKVYCYYGNIPFCTWDGGRIFKEYQPLTIEELYELQQYYNQEMHSKVRFVFTNNLLKKEHLYERYNNLVLDIFNRGDNEIVLNSEILEDYLNTNYPNYKLIASTTKCSNQEKSKIDLNNDNYKFICLDYNLNHNQKFLNSLTEEEKAKTEFLINPICSPGCPQRKEHYRLNSLFSLTYGTKYPLKHCEIKENSGCYLFNPSHISPEELYDKYLTSGFQYFKLEGRTWPSQKIILMYAEYLIKPQYQLFFINSLL